MVNIVIITIYTTSIELNKIEMSLIYEKEM